MSQPTAAPVLAPPFPNFGRWLSFNEGIKSTTAIRKGIDNSLKDLVLTDVLVTAQQLYQNMVRVYQQFYAPLCEHYGLKLPVDSFYRCPKLNKAVGGADGSAHLYGCAIDIDCDSLAHLTNLELFSYCRQTFDFDQLIEEAPDKNNNPSWIHIAINRYGQANRHQVLKMIWQNGRQVYEEL